MPTFTCPHCSSAYTFDGQGMALCPSCKREVYHSAAPQVVERVVYVERKEEGRTNSATRLVAIIIFTMLMLGSFFAGLTLLAVFFGIVLIAVVVGR